MNSADPERLSASSGDGPMTMLAPTLKRERERAGLSISELAARAGVAKSTISQLENAIGNPSLETIWSLAKALNIPFSRLVSSPQPKVQIIRANEGAASLSNDGNYAATLLAARSPGTQLDIYRVSMEPGRPYTSEAHGPYTMEHVILCSGKARIGPTDQAILLLPGDYIRFTADVAHVYDALEPDTLAIVMIEAP